MAAVELLNTVLFNDPALISLYRVESGALTTDSKGSNTLTNNGSTGSGQGIFNGGLAVTSSAQFLSITSDMGINASNAPCTFMAWFKVNTEPSSQQYNIVFQQNTTKNVAFWINYEYNSGTKRLNYTRFRNGVSTDAAFYTVTLGTSAFHLVALTYDGATVKGYFDGQPVTSVSSSGDGNAGLTNGFDIAQDTINGDLNANHGIYDDISIFSRALTASEIANYYNGPAGSYAYFM